MKTPRIRRRTVLAFALSLLVTVPVGVVAAATASAADPVNVTANTVLADGRAADGNPLKISAVDVSGGKVAWIDNSRTGTPNAAWKRTITGASSRSLVLDRATGVSIAQYGDEVLVMQEASVNPQTTLPDLMRIAGSTATSLGTAATLSYRVNLKTAGQFLLADRFNVTRGGASEIFQLGTRTSTSVPRPISGTNAWAYGQNEKWIVRSDYSSDTDTTTIVATDRATGTQEPVGSSPGQAYTDSRPQAVGDYAVWAANDHVYWVSLADPAAGVQSFAHTHATMVSAHGNRFAVGDYDTETVGVYTVGHSTPDFTVGGVRTASADGALKTLDFDYTSIAWVQAGPDGDQLVSAPIPGAKPFSDVSSGNAFAEDIGWLADTGITTGYVDGTFRPGAPITRQAMAAFLFRFLNPGQADPVCTGTTRKFPDVSTGGFCGPIEWLAGTGITSGYKDGTFRPGAPITRQAMAAFLFRSLNPSEPDPVCTGSTRKFPDVPAGGFCGPIEWLSSTGITTGYDDGTFHPGAPISRQAMAAFLHRAEGQ